MQLSRNANGEGTLYQEKDGRWRGQLSYYDDFGSRKRKSFTGKTKTEVRKKKREFIRKLALDEVTSTKECTIVDLLIESAITDYRKNTIKSDSYVRRCETIKIIDKSKMGKMPITQIDESQLNMFLASLSERYSNSVIKKVYDAIKKAFDIALRRKIISVDIIKTYNITKPKSTKKDVKVTAFSRNEQRIFLRALEDKHYREDCVNYKPMFLISMYEGLRMGEVAGLKKSDIDFKKGVIHVRRTVTRGEHYDIELGDTTKTETSERDVPIFPIARPILEEVVRNYKRNRLMLLFYNYRMDRPVSTQQVNCAFKSLCLSCGIDVPKGQGQHKLRHTFATRCLEAGLSPVVVKSFMGHSDISITINAYVDVQNELETDSVSKVQKLLDDMGF